MFSNEPLNKNNPPKIMSSEKTKEDLERELELRQAIERERELADKRYAIKLIETIVFTLMGVLALAVIGALIKLVVMQ